MIKKQYTVGYFDEPINVDDYVECNGEYLSSSEVVELLNEQDEQIQELYEEIDFLTHFIEKQGFKVKRG